MRCSDWLIYEALTKQGQRAFPHGQLSTLTAFFTCQMLPMAAILCSLQCPMGWPPTGGHVPPLEGSGQHGLLKVAACQSSLAPHSMPDPQSCKPAVRHGSSRHYLTVSKVAFQLLCPKVYLLTWLAWILETRSHNTTQAGLKFTLLFF